MILKTRTMLTVGVVLFLCFLFWQPAKAMEGARQGLILWYQVVLPSQFPFIACVNILLQIQSFSHISPHVFNFLSGMISGYPVGSMTAAKLFQEGRLNQKRLTLQAALCNMAGPLFVIGTVGVGLLQNALYGYMLLLIHWACAGSMSIFCALRNKEKSKAAGRQKKVRATSRPRLPIGAVLGDAVGGAAEVMLKVAGFITIFSVILQWIPGWIGAPLEMTNGLRLAAYSTLPMKWKLSACSFLINFSGICVILQSLGAAEEAPIAAGWYLLIKLLQGSVSAIVTLGICQILGM